MPWYIVHLSHQGEKETSKSIIRTVKSFLGKGSNAYIPYVKGNGPEFRREFYLVEGYVFVYFEGKEIRKLLDMEEEPFFDLVVTTIDQEGSRQPEEMPEWRIDEMRRRVKEELENPESIDIEDWVLATDGNCRNLQGEVIAVQGDSATVFFDFHSKIRREDIPLFCLRKKERDEGLESVEVLIEDEDYI